MKKFFILPIYAGALIWLCNGCVTSVPKPEITTESPKVDMSGMKKFYVSRDDGDSAPDKNHLRGLQAVQEALTEHGMPATSGLPSAMPTDIDCKVIIHDRWFWDMETYLLSLDIKFYDAHSGVLLASGHDRRAAPVLRRDPDFLASELIEAIFPASGGSKNK